METLKELHDNLGKAFAPFFGEYSKGGGTNEFPHRLHKNKYLYFIQCGDKVKIGVSSDPESRKGSLQTGAPGKLHVIASLEKMGDKENFCHKRLSHLHISGEWFRYTDEVDALIDELRDSQK
jgi:hypothetical protein